jgi:rifampicin phosphotransferase
LVNHPIRLKFAFRRLTGRLLLRAPRGILQMIQVAWKIQTGRKELSKKAEETLKDKKYSKLSPHEIYAQSLSRSPDLQLGYLRRTVNDFTKNHLYGTFLMTLLIESTIQSILALLTKDLGSEKAMAQSHHFLGENLKTVTSEMSHDLVKAHDSMESWNSFISRYGHRGLDELELSRPRWIETAAATARKPSVKTAVKLKEDYQDGLLKQISFLRRPILLQELEELQRLLKIREEIKMHTMKPYADIRWSLMALGKKFGLGEDVFWLTMDEIQQISSSKNDQPKNDFQAVAKIRRDRARIFKSVEMPMSFSALELAEILSQKPNNSRTLISGVSLSPGIASGLVHIVENPESEDLSTWPENTILVTEATDPGWTPLFERSKAIIVSRGGILSHCAIVAREMGLPAVGKIYGATTLFKEGENVWVDGIHGTITRTR